MGSKEFGSMLKKAGREAFSGVASPCSKKGAWREAWRWKAGQQSSGRTWRLHLGHPSWICSWTWHCNQVIEGGWVMGTEVGFLRMFFDLNVQSAEGGGLGNGGYGA
eukprot:scaffold29318_cov65-Attheya_sp.AAC.1